MFQFILAVLVAVAFIVTPASPSSAAPQAIQVAQADLPAKIKRRIDKVNEALDAFDATPSLGYPRERTLSYMKQNYETAEFEYGKIKEYYGGQFSESHPDYVAAGKRLAAAQTALADYAAGKGSAGDSAAKAAPAKLDGRIVHAIKNADADLAKLNKIVASGGPAERRLRPAKVELEAAEREHEQIVKYYGGKFDPEHPDYKAALARLEAGRQAVAALEKEAGAESTAATSAVPAPAAPAKLDSRIVHAIKNADASLAKLTKIVAAGGPAERRLRPAKVEIEAAEREHAQIVRDYRGKFDTEDPDYKAALARLEGGRQLVAALEKEAAGGAVAAVPAPKGGLPPLSAPEASRARAALEDADTSIVEMTQWLQKPGFTPEKRWQEAQARLNSAIGAHRNVREFHANKFDPADPDYLASQNNLAAARDLMEKFFAKKVAAWTGASVPVPASGNLDPLPSTSRLTGINQVDGLIAQLMEKARTGATAEYVRAGGFADKDGEIIKGQLEMLVQAKQSVADSPDAGLRDVQALLGRIGAAEAAAKAFFAYHGLYGYPPSVALLEARKPTWHYDDQGMTSKRHEAYVGGIVWSKERIGFKTQEAAELVEEFRLTDMIYGRVYMAQSIANAPVFSAVNNKPMENSNNTAQFHLFVDDKEVTVSFDYFFEMNMDAKFARQYTTFQFNPNPETDDSFEKAVAKAWEKATRKMAPGPHKVRFELWGVAGQHRTDGPLATGGFILIKGEGDRLALRTSFPGDDYDGPADVDDLREQMRKALARNGLAKSPDDILKMSVTSDFAYGIYRDTKQRYRRISGAVLWADTNDDKICRFTTYNFISNEAGSDGWSRLQFRSFCLGCPEGDVDCPN